uniref:Flagellar protein FlbB n=1 Tax=Rhodopseudomonas palustris (strain BisA53) TaxID=316055 RepID=Q07RE2_RHOP5
MKLFRDIRVIPVVLIAIFGLTVLKVAGLAIDGGYVFDYTPNPTKKSWAEENLNFPTGRHFEDVTGSTAPKKEEKPVVAAPEVTTSSEPPPEAVQAVSPSERAILERLQARRQEIEARAREVDIRESLLKAAEKRLDAKVEELKGAEARVATAGGQKAEAESTRFKSIITMYEGMKPKDAAKVFDRLEMAVLFEIASQIAPRKMSDILGQMSPEAAEKLTVELARRAGGGDRSVAVELPKIEGRPQPNRN